MLISIEGTGKKIIWNQAWRVWEMLQCCHVVLRWEILDENHLVCWSIVVKEKPTFYSPFFEAFPSDRILKATNFVSVHFFIHCSDSPKLYQRIQEIV
jgi:hypothetical protein